MSSQVPWFRLVTDGVVIVCSVLLEFGIDASWQERHERAAAAALASLLLADVQADLAEMTQAAANGSTTRTSLSIHSAGGGV